MRRRVGSVSAAASSDRLTPRASAPLGRPARVLRVRAWVRDEKWTVANQPHRLDSSLRRESSAACVIGGSSKVTSPSTPRLERAPPHAPPCDSGQTLSLTAVRAGSPLAVGCHVRARAAGQRRSRGGRTFCSRFMPSFERVDRPELEPGRDRGTRKSTGAAPSAPLRQGRRRARRRISPRASQPNLAAASTRRTSAEAQHAVGGCSSASSRRSARARRAYSRMTAAFGGRRPRRAPACRVVDETPRSTDALCRRRGARSTSTPHREGPRRPAGRAHRVETGL